MRQHACSPDDPRARSRVCVVCQTCACVRACVCVHGVLAAAQRTRAARHVSAFMFCSLALARRALSEELPELRTTLHAAIQARPAPVRAVNHAQNESAGPTLSWGQAVAWGQAVVTLGRSPCQDVFYRGTATKILILPPV